MFIPSRLALAEEDVGSLGLGAKIGEKIMNARTCGPSLLHAAVFG